MNHLESMLKKQMEYSEDLSTRCANCTHGGTLEGVKADDDPTPYICIANKAIDLRVIASGRCKLFSAKRTRKSSSSTHLETPEGDPDFREIDE